MHVREVALRFQGRILEIKFADATLAWYERVPPDVYTRLVESASPDEVFEQEIENRYTLLGVGKPKSDTDSR